MTIFPGDTIGLFGEISGHRVEEVIGPMFDVRAKYLLDDGRVVQLSDIHSHRTETGQDTITETRYDGVIRTIDQDDR